MYWASHRGYIPSLISEQVAGSNRTNVGFVPTPYSCRHFSFANDREVEMRFIALTLFIFCLPLFTGCQSLQRPGTQQNGLFGLRRGPERTENLDDLLDPMGERSVNGFLLQDLTPSQISTTLKSRFVSKDPAKAETVFREAQALYSKAVTQMESEPDGDAHIEIFEDAAKKFQLAANLYPESSIEEDSLFYEGESYFFADRYVQSNRAYEKLIALYSGTRFLDKAERNRFSIAQYWLQLAEKKQGISLADPKRPGSLKSEARRILHRIRIDDPTGKLADDATMALGMAYFQDERYFEAADTLEDLRRSYPGSQHQYLAHLYEFKARLKSYRGRSYDDTSLKKADVLLEQIVKRFPQQAREEKEFLSIEANRIRNLKAERDLGMAKYYENRGENRAARVYYEQVAANYGDTQIAAEVGSRIADLKQKPDLPTQRGEWLVNLFPDESGDKPLLTAEVKEKLIR